MCHHNWGSASPLTEHVPAQLGNTGAHTPQWIWPELLMRRWWAGRKSRSFYFCLPAPMEIGFVLCFHFQEFQREAQ